MTRQEIILQRCTKRKLSLRYWLQGRNFFRALDALDLASEYHNGVRKDGFTPELDHMISIAHHVRTLPDLINKEETLITALLHDTMEDYDLTEAEVEKRYGHAVLISCKLLNKYDEFGREKNQESLVQALALDPYASIVKPCDRGHNLGSMVGVFTPEKQRKYIDDAEKYVAMMKTARRKFPQQEPAYENIKHFLTMQMTLLRLTLGEDETLVESFNDDE